MAKKYSYISYQETGYFSKLVVDYLSGNENIKSFYKFEPDANGIRTALEARKKYTIDRETLVNTLNKQYKGLKLSEKTGTNITSLLKNNTFTVCTAHQPNLLTGYLYFLHKILHTIKLADSLNREYPENHFVPVYYMGSEDNDLEELGTFRFEDKKYTWDGNGQKGAVGRMHPDGLNALLHELFKNFGPPGENCDNLKQMITQAYLGHETIGEATKFLVNELFGVYGLVIVDPDDADFKKQFKPIIIDECFNQSSYPILTKQIDDLEKHYKIQAHPRNINLFYLDDQCRERIEQKDKKWVVLNTTIEWSQEELLSEIEQHPKRFSPNVVLRGLFQETILPNIAFIGGGAEVAYWMQLKSLFEYYNVFFPVVLLRQSVLIAKQNETQLNSKIGISIEELFKNEQAIIDNYTIRHSDTDWQTISEQAALEQIFSSLEQKALNVDPTLRLAVKAALTKMKQQTLNIEKKMLRAERKKNEIEINRIKKLRNSLFPNNSLQERVENFMPYYLEFGAAIFDDLLDGIQPLQNEFLLIEYNH